MTYILALHRSLWSIRIHQCNGTVPILQLEAYSISLSIQAPLVSSKSDATKGNFQSASTHRRIELDAPSTRRKSSTAYATVFSSIPPSQPYG